MATLALTAPRKSSFAKALIVLLALFAISFLLTISFGAAPVSLRAAIGGDAVDATAIERDLTGHRAERVDARIQCLVPSLRVELDAQRPLLLAVQTLEHFRELFAAAAKLRLNHLRTAEQRERAEWDDRAAGHQRLHHSLMPIADRAEPLEVTLM